MEEVKWVNNQLDVDDSQKTRLKTIKSTVEVAARDLKMKDAGIKKNIGLLIIKMLRYPGIATAESYK